MKFISTLMHGIMDYTIAALLIVAPGVFGFANDRVETILPVVLGFGLLAYSLFTNYELSLFKRLSLRTHLRLDILSGILLAVSPWLFNFDEYVYQPHLIIGLVAIGMALFTKPYTTEKPPVSEFKSRLREYEEMKK